MWSAKTVLLPPSPWCYSTSGNLILQPLFLVLTESSLCPLPFCVPRSRVKIIIQEHLAFSLCILVLHVGQSAFSSPVRGGWPSLFSARVHEICSLQWWEEVRYWLKKVNAMCPFTLSQRVVKRGTLPLHLYVVM